MEQYENFLNVMVLTSLSESDMFAWDVWMFSFKTLRTDFPFSKTCNNSDTTKSDKITLLLILFAKNTWKWSNVNVFMDCVYYIWLNITFVKHISALLSWIYCVLLTFSGNWFELGKTHTRFLKLPNNDRWW